MKNKNVKVNKIWNNQYKIKSNIKLKIILNYFLNRDLQKLMFKLIVK